ncbi:imidazole glycerol phosphate synthase subunit HisH [Magnetococcus marinus]|nr:imidazole glycerol phosphate synthase subunit HisH [Magnetococcus marinus]
MNVVVDYGCGNLASIVNMAKKAGYGAVISSDPAQIAKATRLILPGVGAYDQGMAQLQQRGLREVLDEQVLKRKVPLLGICLGAQLIARGSEEGVLPGLGWIAADVVRFDASRMGQHARIPHIGWCDFIPEGNAPLVAQMEAQSRFYFVHSYHLQCEDANDVMGRAVHGYSFVAAVARDNIFGVQFHPEKSHRFGLHLLTRFFELPAAVPSHA